MGTGSPAVARLSSLPGVFIYPTVGCSSSDSEVCASKIKIEVKGSGQECPLHTSRIEENYRVAEVGV